MIDSGVYLYRKGVHVVYLNPRWLFDKASIVKGIFASAPQPKSSKTLRCLLDKKNVLFMNEFICK